MTPVGIVGFSGYSGAELVSILLRHPHVEPVLLEHRETEDRPRPIHYQGPRRLPLSAKLPLVFLATPPEVSLDLTPAFLDSGAQVIDLSGAFRLGTVENYRRWYSAEHPRPDLPEDLVKPTNDAWQQMQEELSHLSTKGTRVIAKGSGHYIQIDRPEVVIEAVHNILDQARRTQHTSPP